MTDRTTDEQEQDAIRVLRQSYYQTVRACADDIISEAEKLDADEREEYINDAADEYADGNEWVIYTWRARLVRSLSDNAEAVDDHLSLDEGEDLDKELTFAAYCALRADILDTVRRAMPIA